MDKSKVYVFLDPGHCKSTPGKCAPDKSIREYSYVREIVAGIEKKLAALGVKTWNTHPEEDFVYTTKGTCSSLDSRDLALRVTRINAKVSGLKAQGYKSFMVSVHLNAAGNGTQWMNATGWSTWTTKGKTNSDKLADCLYDAAEAELKPLGMKIRTDMSDGDRDYESDFYILKKSNCACTLTESFFQDNKKDVEFLLSEKGKQAIINLHVNGILKYIETL